MNQDRNPDKEFRLKLKLLDNREETKERLGEENADFDDESITDSYFVFPKAGTGDEQNMPFLKNIVVSPRKPNVSSPKAASRIFRLRKSMSNPFANIKKENSIMTRVHSEADNLTMRNTLHPSFRRLRYSNL